MFLSLMQPAFYWDTMIFGLAVVVGFFAPGYALISRLPHLRPASRLCLSSAIGLVLFTWLSLGLAWLQVRWLLPIILLLINLVVVRQIWLSAQHRSRPPLMPKKQKPTLICLLGLALILQLPAVFGSGLQNQQGEVRFYFTNHQDGLMHVGISNFLQDHFPPLRPEINAPLENYHYFTDLVVANVATIFKLPTINLFFQWFPIFLCLTTTSLIYELTYFLVSDSPKRQHAPLFATITTLTFLLSGDGAYLVSLLFQGRLNWHLPSYDNGGDQFLNPPYAFAKLIFLAGLFLLIYFWQTKAKPARARRLSLTLVGLAFAVLVMFKVYFIFLALGGWTLALAYQWAVGIGQRRFPKQLKLETGVYLISIILAGLLLLSNTSQGNSFFYVPLVFPRQFVSAPNLDWQDWWLRRQVYEEAGNWPRLFLGNGQITLIALILIFGWRLLGFYPSKHVRAIFGPKLWWFFYPLMFGFVIFGLNTMQTKGGLNTHNFFIIATLGLNLILGCNIAWLYQRRARWGKVLALGLLLALAPRTLYNAGHFIKDTFSSWDTSGLYQPGELALLQFLREQTPRESVVQTSPANRKSQMAGYINALANRRTYLSADNILGSHNVDFTAKQQRLEFAFSEDQPTLYFTLKDMGVDYLYLTAADLMLYPQTASFSAVITTEAGRIIDI